MFLYTHSTYFILHTTNTHGVLHELTSRSTTYTGLSRVALLPDFLTLLYSLGTYCNSVYGSVPFQIERMSYTPIAGDLK